MKGSVELCKRFKATEPYQPTTKTQQTDTGA